jgi:hypothetical protein
MNHSSDLVLPSQPRRLNVFFKRGGLIGVASALTIAIFANLLAARYDKRYDVTADQRYTPSPILRQLLSQLKAPVTVVVLLGRGDTLAPSIEQLLQSYRDVSRQLTIDWVDPDKEPARYLSKQSELGLRVGRTEGGQVTTDALVVLTHKERKYYVTPEDITGLDPEHSDGGSSFEHSFAIGLKSLFRETKPVVCFTTGHRELALTDTSPIGITRFKERLERDALSTKTVDLTTNETLEPTCRLVIVAAPDVPLSSHAVAKLTQAVKATTNLLLLGGVAPNPDGKLISLGFEPIAKLAGIALLPNVVIELSEEYRLPNLFGETFFASPAEHPVNRGLFRGTGDTPLRVVVALAQSQTALAGGPARPLLTSSRKAITLTDVSSLASPQSAESESSYVVAMAGLVERNGAPANRVVVMPTNLVQNRTFDSPALVVTQAFTDSVTSWLTEESAFNIEYTPRRPRPLGLSLSEEEMTQIIRYVLYVMPLSVLVSGFGVFLMRRGDGRPKKSNRNEKGQ